MPAVNLTAYVKHKDKHGLKIGDWATQVGLVLLLVMFVSPSVKYTLIHLLSKL